MFSIALLALLALPQGVSAQRFGGNRQAQTRVATGASEPNIVLIIADDFGVDLMPSYAEGADLPCTPVLDTLTSEGMLFRNAWASPMCSPARAQLLTGRYGFRTGIGTPGGVNLMLSETILPEMLTGYSTTAVGKWHLGPNGDIDHPNDSGFQHFAGSRGNLGDYFDWTKWEDGVQSNSTTYATTDAVDEAIGAIQTMPEPFFVYVALHAPHGPSHVPDPSLCNSGNCPGGDYCGIVTNGSPNWQKTRAMVEAMDTELDRLLTALDTVDPNAYVFFIGDNGTGNGATRPPFVNGHAKSTLYEGGVNVPLVVKGPGIPAGSESQGLISAVDMYATFAELAGKASTTEDSISMVPYFSNPGLSLRPTVYSEKFQPNHQTLPFSNHERAVRDSRYKLIRRTDPNQADELYDLLVDPFESNDLIPSLVPGSSADIAYQALVAELVALGVN